MTSPGEQHAVAMGAALRIAEDLRTQAHDQGCEAIAEAIRGSTSDTCSTGEPMHAEASTGR